METQSLELRHFLINSIKNPYTKEDYFQIWYEGTLTGYIDKNGVFLLCYHSKCPEGVWVNIEVWRDKTTLQRAQLVKQHWSAIFDRFTLWMKFNH